jgi:cell division inhibitor SulA/protein ImuA
VSAALEQLRRHPAMWRREAPPADALSTGFPALDEVLPDAGWPMGALTEILVPRAGAGELRLVLPALAELGTRGRWLAWVGPPHVPYAPALAARGIALSRILWVRGDNPAQQLWSAEQALRSGVCGAVLIACAVCSWRRRAAAPGHCCFAARRRPGMHPRRRCGCGLRLPGRASRWRCSSAGASLACGWRSPWMHNNECTRFFKGGRST